MKKTLKKYFVPHEHNNYHPHILHTKRAVFYTAFFASIKVILIIFALSIPEAVFVTPDILALQEDRLVALANDLRQGQGAGDLRLNVKLDGSAQLKSDNMAEYSYFSHTNPDGQKLSYYLKQVGYNYSVGGENLAMGYTDAEELFSAWVNSPSHYSNLIDASYNDTGIGISAGFYDNIPTIYVAQHFGALKPAAVAKTAEVKSEPVKTAVSVVSTTPAAQEEKILSEQTTAPAVVETAPVVAKPEIVAPVTTTRDNLLPFFKPTTLTYQEAGSFIAWQDAGEKMKLTVFADISGEVKTASAGVKNYTIELSADETSGKYKGSLVINESSDEFFKAIFPARLVATAENGEAIEGNIPWQSIKVPSPTVMERYFMAKENLGPLTGIFNFSKNIYLAFLTFFVIALGFNIIWEIKKQHPHIIAQTMGMIGVLVLFYVI